MEPVQEKKTIVNITGVMKELVGQILEEQARTLRLLQGQNNCEAVEKAAEPTCLLEDMDNLRMEITRARNNAQDINALLN